MTGIFGTCSLQLHNDTKMSPRLKSFFFFFIVTSIVCDANSDFNFTMWMYRWPTWNSHSKGESNMVAEIVKEFALSSLKVTTLHKWFSAFLVLCGTVGK
jgi:hypothetical protein